MAYGAGVVGYLLKDVESGRAAAAISADMSGEVHLESAVVWQVVRQVSAFHVGLIALTARDRGMFALGVPTAQSRSGR